MKALQRFIGVGFGSGLLPTFPGTWGSLAALLPIYFILLTNNIYLLLAFIVLCSLLTLWVSTACEEQWGKDPSKVVMDEWAGQAVCFISIYFASDMVYNLAVLGAGFILFRFFDILKPLGIKKLQKFEGGIGILIDDLLAGLYALICLKTLIFIWPNF